MSLLAPFPAPARALFLGLPVTIGQAVLFHAAEADLPFLRRLYRTTREDELAVTGWPEAAKQAFCDSQFELQHAHYVRQYPGGEFLLLRAGHEAVGRLYCDATGDSVHLIDISFLPAWRGRGTGSAVLREMQERAAAAGKAVTLHVLAQNTHAAALYRRFGFVAGVKNGAHVAMRWSS